ncbi:MAG: hypothetical protein QXK08_02235 [Candidatus Woesearchaeota archaeon]
MFGWRDWTRKSEKLFTRQYMRQLREVAYRLDALRRVEPAGPKAELYRILRTVGLIKPVKDARMELLEAVINAASSAKDLINIYEGNVNEIARENAVRKKYIKQCGLEARAYQHMTDKKENLDVQRPPEIAELCEKLEEEEKKLAPIEQRPAKWRREMANYNKQLLQGCLDSEKKEYAKFKKLLDEFRSSRKVLYEIAGLIRKTANMSDDFPLAELIQERLVKNNIFSTQHTLPVS